MKCLGPEFVAFVLERPTACVFHFMRFMEREALVGLALGREAIGDTAGALDAYIQAGALFGPYRDDALRRAARLDEAAGDADEARDIYARLMPTADPELRLYLATKLPPGQAAAASPPAAIGAPPGAAAAANVR